MLTGMFCQCKGIEWIFYDDDDDGAGEKQFDGRGAARFPRRSGHAPRWDMETATVTTTVMFSSALIGTAETANRAMSAPSSALSNTTAVRSCLHDHRDCQCWFPIHICIVYTFV